jgi:hypothetical protein
MRLRVGESYTPSTFEEWKMIVELLISHNIPTSPGLRSGLLDSKHVFESCPTIGRYSISEFIGIEVNPRRSPISRHEFISRLGITSDIDFKTI